MTEEQKAQLNKLLDALKEANKKGTNNSIEIVDKPKLFPNIKS